MELEFFRPENLKEMLEELSPLHRIAFAASICERMIPIYDLFSKQESWGDVSVLRKSADEVWGILQTNSVNSEQIQQLIKECDEQVLHADYVKKSRLDYEAQQTVSAICYTLEFCL